MMASLSINCLLITKFFLIVIFNGIIANTDLREQFYNQLRTLIETSPFPQEGKDVILRPVEEIGWGQNLTGLGQVSGVSVNPNGNPVIFHRGSRIWDLESFNSTNIYQHLDEGAIDVDTVLTLDRNTGEVISSWGKDMFYMPHGITVDHHFNTWVTDVAMHQVFKFPRGWLTPSLILGELFTPGHDETRFCKPTSVAVASSGHIFVADGYCNNRILKYNHKGVLERIFPQHEEFLSLLVPHSLTLIEKHDLICVADRENMRVACWPAEIGYKTTGYESFSPFTIHQPDLGRVFGIAALGDLVYAINGPTSSHIPIQGFTINPFAETIVDHWRLSSQEFKKPHAISVSPHGDALYITEIGPNKVWKFSFKPKQL
ncbi:hypothetical protein O3M35_004089 [Rhynocoris fuscipes]|uniref:peptidylamidoglycolate lyase n=1 Tax=Rhynocoris fuscipes TaxID=488301 RepID=A0AAW1CIA6_9HEMI